MFDGVTAEWFPGAGREQRVRWVPAAFGEPGAQRFDGVGNQWCSSFLAAFANGVHVGTGAHGDVGDGEPDQLGYA